MDGTNLTDIGVAAAIVGGGYLAFKLMGGGGGGGGGGGWTPDPPQPEPPAGSVRISCGADKGGDNTQCFRAPPPAGRLSGWTMWCRSAPLDEYIEHPYPSACQPSKQVAAAAQTSFSNFISYFNNWEKTHEGANGSPLESGTSCVQGSDDGLAIFYEGSDMTKGFVLCGSIGDCMTEEAQYSTNCAVVQPGTSNVTVFTPSELQTISTDMQIGYTGGTQKGWSKVQQFAWDYLSGQYGALGSETFTTAELNMWQPPQPQPLPGESRAPPNDFFGGRGTCQTSYENRTSTNSPACTGVIIGLPTWNSFNACAKSKVQAAFSGNPFIFPFWVDTPTPNTLGQLGLSQDVANSCLTPVIPEYPTNTPQYWQNVSPPDCYTSSTWVNSPAPVQLYPDEDWVGFLASGNIGPYQAPSSTADPCADSETIFKFNETLAIANQNVTWSS